ncbi:MULTISPECIES: peptidase U32 family protein [unclassified Lactococcus]|uniref:peptidase U32 family protein n=1 Tax=unclassified Lactococcus TaxID=2643510 RepID=UPI0011C76893|nr:MULTISPECIES: peptidase U32 family protein [unclassified Lactococcus]MQW23498.1 U32 family peptidase [Lactococcus sp. dk101]TXK37829.1 U32 family peptidase [Lactococcus sp. dk310]TXK49314.1 U32 family peptidase [Lactococcus sp. dk322]
MIKIIATAESVEQAKALIAAGVDNITIGDADFALHVPTALSYEDIREITHLAHDAHKTVTVAVNALMHVEMMAQIKPYLDFLQEISVDQISVGDAGVVFVLQRDGYKLPYIYDASTLVTSARQVNFWASQGAVGAVLARELPKAELEALTNHLDVPVEFLVYGATVIHHSKRPLLQNYFNFIQADSEKEGKNRQANHFISEPKHDETHYSIFEDKHGTHIFANDDINMMTELADLVQMGFTNWKLDGIFTRGTDFVAIVKRFIEAKELIEAGTFDIQQATRLDQAVRELHPAGRTLSHGFYDLDPKKIK